MSQFKTPTRPSARPAHDLSEDEEDSLPCHSSVRSSSQSSYRPLFVIPGYDIDNEDSPPRDLSQDPFKETSGKTSYIFSLRFFTL